MIMTMKMGMRTQSRSAGSRKSDCVMVMLVRRRISATLEARSTLDCDLLLRRTPSNMYIPLIPLLPLQALTD
jgi:hypothetical protein